MAESYYDVLGVPPDASREEIESAYRERVLETHPDHNDDPNAAEAFKRVTDAEEVLTDETERARYDRLGHESYVRFTERFGAAGASTGGDDRADDGQDGPRSARGTADARSSDEGATGSSTTSTTAGRNASTDGTDGRSRERGAGTAAGSHHARQRARRQRAKYRRAAGHGSERQRTEQRERRRDRGREDRTRERRRRRTRSRQGRTTADAGGEDPEEETDSFRYSIHEWDEDEVSVEDDRPSIDHHTAVFLACLTVLYPMLVYSSVTAAFPLVVNAVVAACTLCLVGYLLTMPRIAVVAFGGWSLLAPAAWRLEVVDLTLVTAAIIVGGFWIPFGYALVVRRVIRP